MRYILILLLISFILIGCEFHIEPYKKSHEANKGLLAIHYANASNHDYHLITMESLFEYVKICRNDKKIIDSDEYWINIYPEYEVVHKSYGTVHFQRIATLDGFVKWVEAKNE